MVKLIKSANTQRGDSRVSQYLSGEEVGSGKREPYWEAVVNIVGKVKKNSVPRAGQREWLHYHSTTVREQKMMASKSNVNWHLIWKLPVCML